LGARGTGRGARKSQGFTLIELALVAVALAMLLAAAMPRFSDVAGRLRLEQAAFGMARGLRTAHELAVTQGRVVTWAWDDDARRARLATLDPDGHQTWLTGTLGHSETVPSALTVAVEFDDAAEAGQLQFYPDGTSQPGLLRLSDARASYTITMDPSTGQPRLAAAHVAP